MRSKIIIHNHFKKVLKLVHAQLLGEHQNITRPMRQKEQVERVTGRGTCLCHLEDSILQLKGGVFTLIAALWFSKAGT